MTISQGAVAAGDAVAVRGSADANVLLFNASAALRGSTVAGGLKDGVQASTASV